MILQCIVLSNNYSQLCYSHHYITTKGCLTVSDNLLWNNNVNEAIKKVNKRFFFLIQLKRAKVPTKDLIQFYTTCIRPILDYGAPVYHYALPQYLQESLERLQKRVLSIIFPEVSYQDSLQFSCLSSLSSRRQELCDKLFSSVALTVITNFIIIYTKLVLIIIT